MQFQRFHNHKKTANALGHVVNYDSDCGVGLLFPWCALVQVLIFLITNELSMISKNKL